MKLSPTMQDALAKAKAHGGKLERWKGGFWTYHACPYKGPGVPEWWVSAGTVRALIDRGAMQPSAFQKAAKYGNPFMVEVELVPAPPAREFANDDPQESITNG